MKKILRKILVLIIIPVLFFSGCKKSEDYEIKYVSSYELINKIENKETFVVVLGSRNCSHCKKFMATLNRYVSEGHNIYYLDFGNPDDSLIKYIVDDLELMLVNDIPSDRGIEYLGTPTTIYVQDGEFKDAVQGAFGMNNEDNYQIFCDIVAGKYVDREATYEIDWYNE